MPGILTAALQGGKANLLAVTSEQPDTEDA
jgi:hypothetical protein